MAHIAKIESRVAGIPCLIGVFTFDSVDGCHSADSDVDYYGYTESDWEVLDRRGRPAGWLSKKLTSKETDRIETEIVEYFNS